MHVTADTIWEAELRRQDLATTARQQRLASEALAPGISVRSRRKAPPMPSIGVAVRYARSLLTSLASVAFSRPR